MWAGMCLQQERKMIDKQKLKTPPKIKRWAKDLLPEEKRHMIKVLRKMAKQEQDKP